MPHITANQVDFHYQQQGAGPDVVLIHGITGDLSVWFLCQAMGSLSRSFRVTAYDLRGHGYSSVPPTGYTSADQARDTLALMDALAINQAALVGHSFGGVIALHAAQLAPDRVTPVVLSDPSFPALRHLENLNRWGHWESFRQQALNAGVELSAEYWYDLARFFDQVNHLQGERLLKFRQAVGLPSFNRLLRLAQTTCGADAQSEAGLTLESMAAVRQPVLALFGQDSPFLATADALIQHLPHCTRQLVPGAQHRAPEENPAEFTRLVEQFLLEHHLASSQAQTRTH